LNKSIYVSIIIVSLLLGLMISFQFRTKSNPMEVVPPERYQELMIEKKRVETDIPNLEEEVADLTAKTEEARKGRTQ
jgi:peptidoglycan hydrolase CwlO-like protein